ncbi:MAG: Nif3-like dinuclear metal center hexameric protein [Patescibacteria group bacterium]|nr:Nif3-like dinuclear metal center hexameric protein [Patescibacteria group bacterium]
MLVERDKIVEYCSKKLKVDEFNDLCWNGLQIEGTAKVNKIVTAVSLSEEVIKAAIKKKAQMIMVHHGITRFHFGNQPRIRTFLKKRLRLILENNINLCGFHLPLDAHPEFGNNAHIIKLLGVKQWKILDDGQYGEILFVGKLEKSMKRDEFISLVDLSLNTSTTSILAGPEKIEIIGVVSGAGSDDFKIAYENEARTFITGELREHNVWEAREMGVNLIGAGHYNTEVFGIKNLGSLIAKEFNIKAEFVDTPCEI